MRYPTCHTVYYLVEATINNSKQFKWLNGYIENQIIVALKKNGHAKYINVKQIIDKNS